jgi:SAM-dependent methyltransferase
VAKKIVTQGSKDMLNMDYESSKLSTWGEFAYRIRRVVSVLHRLERYTSMQGKNTLDVGCGYGPGAFCLSKKGNHVVAVDIDLDSIKEARTYVIKEIERIDFVQNVAENLALKDEMFDIVMMFDVLEHVKSPEKTLKESVRVLKRNGLLYVEYNPYYSLAGSHLYDYTLLPVQFLPEKLVRSYVTAKTWNPFNPKNFKNRKEELAHKLFVLDAYSNLNRLTDRGFHRIINNLGIRILEERYTVSYPDKFEIDLTPIKCLLGPLKELAFSYQAILEKPA